LDLSTETTSTSASFTKSDGIYWFHLRVIDKAGNSSNTVRYKFIIDTTSPIFEITSYDDPASIGNISLNVTANERLKQTPLVSVKQNGQVTSSIITMISSDDIVWIGTYTVVSGYDGLAAINVSGTDIANNISISSGSFVVDTIVPTASISILPTSPLKTGRFDIALTITDTNNTLQDFDFSPRPKAGKKAGNNS